MSGFFWGAASALVAVYIFQPPRSFWGTVGALVGLAMAVSIIEIIKELRT